MSISPQRIPVDERARRYLLKLEAPRRNPADPQDSHTVVFNAARALVHGFGFSQDQAYPLLKEYLDRSDAPWSESEINHKLRQIDSLQSKFPRGYLVQGDTPQFPNAATRQATGKTTEVESKKKIEFDAAKLTELAHPWNEVVDLVWLANRSAVDPATVGPADFLRLMYPGGEKILCFTQPYTQGEALWPGELPPTTAREGVWFLPQPVCGEFKLYPEGKERKDGKPPESRRQWRCVEDFRYLLLESDKAPMRDWLGFIAQVPLQIEALYTSGGRSIHALVRVDCRTKEEWDDEKRALMPFLMGCVMVGGDRGVLSAVRLSRLPGALREGKKGDDDSYQRYSSPRLQKLLYVRPKAAVRPICEMPAVRDVEKGWLALAAAGLSDAAETVDAELLGKVRRGLGYYANVSAALRAKLGEINDQFPMTNSQ